MKSKLITLLLAFTGTIAFAHTGVELGPNGGRILEFSKNETLHGEVTVKDGKFHIAVLDKELKPVAITDQTLTVTGGDRNSPEKLAVEKQSTHFVVPTVKEGQWVIVQFRGAAGAKPITARFQYDTSTCGECQKPEWVCACAANKASAKKK